MSGETPSRVVPLCLCGGPPHFSSLWPIPAKIRCSLTSWYSLVPESSSRPEQDLDRAFLHRRSLVRFQSPAPALSTEFQGAAKQTRGAWSNPVVGSTTQTACLFRPF